MTDLRWGKWEKEQDEKEQDEKEQDEKEQDEKEQDEMGWRQGARARDQNINTRPILPSAMALLDCHPFISSFSHSVQVSARKPVTVTIQNP